MDNESKNEVVKIDRRTKDLKHEKNPFLANTVAEVDIGYKKTTFGTGKRVNETETGEDLGEAAFQQVRVVDKSKFLMFYLSGQQMFWQLSAKAQKVLRLIFNEVSYRAIGKDEIYLSWEIAEKFFKNEEIKMGRSTYFKAIAELTDKLVIAESIRTNIWFINPVLIFNGNRATFVQKIIAEDPDLVEEAQEITAKRSLEAMRKLDKEKLKDIGSSIKTKGNK
jgi:intergrase/recombinase